MSKAELYWKRTLFFMVSVITLVQFSKALIEMRAGAKKYWRRRQLHLQGKNRSTNFNHKPAGVVR